jgi:hypothetical protein
MASSVSRSRETEITSKKTYTQKSKCNMKGPRGVGWRRGQSARLEKGFESIKNINAN